MFMRSNSNQYEEITSDDRSFWDVKSFFRTCSLMKIVMLGMVVLLSGIIVVQGVHEHNEELEFRMETHEVQIQQQSQIEHQNTVIVQQSAEAAQTAIANQQALEERKHEQEKQERDKFIPFVSQHVKSLPIPPGVNLGSWLSLEDYFFSGMQNSVEVATPGMEETASTVAACLPPLHVGSSTGPKWQSETDLFKNLMDPELTPGGSVIHAIEVFAAHRASFIDLETDLAKIAALGVKTVRIPISWCWTDVDPRHVDLYSYESDADLLRDFACVDPFFGNDESEEQVLWPAIPKSLIEQLLRSCARAGIRASLDVHTYPGGTSIGTFSGVWPHFPRFWTKGGDGVQVEGGTHNAASNGFNIGHNLFSELVAWMENLSEKDPEAFNGLRGLSPMNEPAHLAGLFSADDPKNFLPPLPRAMADEYLDTLGKGFPDGTHLRVMHWLGGAVDTFRKSRLPSLGKELHMNIHESIMEAQAEEWWALGSWWCNKGAQTTLPQERSDWAILDMHHYHAWAGQVCSGTIDGQKDSAYACGDIETRNEVMDYCMQWADTFRMIADGQCGVDPTPAKLMSGEFSAASHHTVRRSCNDVATLHESYIRQIDRAKAADIELFYWSYKMPYGGSFRGAGWSFTELMYKFGVLARPDTPMFECNAHQPAADNIPPYECEAC